MPSNTFNIVMTVFDVSQHVIRQSAGLIQGSTAVTPEALENMQTQLEAMELGSLLGIPHGALTKIFVVKYAVEFHIKSGYTKGRKGECDYAKYQTNL